MKIEEHLQSIALPAYKKAIVNLLFTSHWLNDEISDVLKPFDISTQQFNVLRILKGRKGKAANLSSIQKRMIAKNSNATRLVDKLILKGLVIKETCEANKRKVEIFITAEGELLLEKLNTVVESKEQHIVAKLSEEEQHTLTELLTKIRHSNHE
jgi:DNA-binding MarR family transcriptional regulator